MIKKSRKQKRNDSNEEAAVSLCVWTGGFRDPDELPGLAHLLEHGVFRGTWTYRKEHVDKYFISSNAATESEHTIFVMTVDGRELDKGLDRFAHWFIDPMLAKDDIDGEINAIDDEYSLARTDDDVCIEQLFGNLARKYHPMSKFQWGNSKTLRDSPRRAGIDIVSHLRVFLSRYYLGQNMTLAIQSSESLDMLESLVRAKFSAIESTNDAKPSFRGTQAPFDLMVFNKIIKVQPIEMGDRLLLTWFLPSCQEFYRAKPLSYLGWLLRHRGEGGLYSYLRKRNWVSSLKAGLEDSEFGNNGCASLFRIDISLSENGLNHLQEIISTVFDYMRMLTVLGPSKRIFEEVKTIEEMRFIYDEQTLPEEYVQELALALHHYEPHDCLRGSHLFLEFREDLIRFFLGGLTPNRVSVLVLSRAFDEAAGINLRCPWFGTRYGISDIPSDWMDRWNDPQMNADLHLPDPNEYITHNFSLKGPDAAYPATEFPVIISTAPFSVYFKKDNHFKIPKAYIYLCLESASVNMSATSIALTDIVQLLIVHLSQLFDAREAGLDCSVQTESNGVVVEWSGYNEHIEKLFQVVVDKAAHLQFSEQDFTLVTKSMKVSYQNSTTHSPTMLRDLRRSLMVHNYWSNEDRLAALSSVNTQDVQDFYKDFISSCSVQMLAQGNFTPQEALQLQGYAWNALGRSPQSSAVANQGKFEVTKLAMGSVIYRRKNTNKGDDNLYLSVYWQFGQANLRQHQMLDLLVEEMAEPAFDRLRTQLQLGYRVSCSAANDYGVIGLLLEITSQASKFKFAYINWEVQAFVSGFVKNIKGWSTSSFASKVKSQIVSKQYKDGSLEEDVARNWAEIVDGSLLFNRTKREVEELQQITLHEFINFVNFLSEDQSRKLKIEVGNEEVPKKLRDVDGNLYITDISKYKSSCEKYAASKIA